MPRSCLTCLLCSGTSLVFVCFCFKETAIASLSISVKPLRTAEAPMGVKGRQSSSTYNVLACLAYLKCVLSLFQTYFHP